MLFQVSLSFCIGMYSYLFRSNETHTPGLDMPESWMVLGREYIHAGSELSNHLNHSLSVPNSGSPHFRFLVEWMNSLSVLSLPSVYLAVNRVDFLPLGVEEVATVLMDTDSQGLTLGVTGSISCHRGTVFLLCPPQGALFGRVNEHTGAGSGARAPPTTQQPFVASSSPLSRGCPREQKAASSPVPPRPRPLSFMTGYKIYLVLLADSLSWCPAWLVLRGFFALFVGV